MWNLTTRLPHRMGVAVSGGADSMALLHFLARNQNRDIHAFMYDHGTGAQHEAEPIVRRLCDQYDIPLYVGHCDEVKPSDFSPEEHWRNCRYAWLESQPMVIATGHHLNDVAETWLWGSVNGQPRLIPSSRNNIIRPLLAVSRQEIEDYCVENKINFWNDPSNLERRYTRNRIRQDMIPAAISANPGFLNMLRRKIIKRDRSQG